MKWLRRMVLTGALLMYVWHLGQMSVLHPLQPTSAGGDNPVQTIFQEHQATKRENLGQMALRQFAVGSRYFIGQSLKTLQYDALQLWDRLQAPDSQKALKSGEGVIASAVTSLPGQLVTAWRQMEPLMVSLQPIAKSAWSMSSQVLQSGWKELSSHGHANTHTIWSSASEKTSSHVRVP
jgi:hypothetical protein